MTSAGGACYRVGRPCTRETWKSCTMDSGISSSFRSVRSAWRMGRRGLPLGAGMAVRRAAYDDLHGFDELLGPGAVFGAAEDNDLSWRGLLQGWATVYTGDVEVVHDGFRDLEQLPIGQECMADGSPRPATRGGNGCEESRVRRSPRVRRTARSGGGVRGGRGQ